MYNVEIMANYNDWLYTRKAIEKEGLPKNKKFGVFFKFFAYFYIVFAVLNILIQLGFLNNLTQSSYYKSYYEPIISWVGLSACIFLFVLAGKFLRSSPGEDNIDRSSMDFVHRTTGWKAIAVVIVPLVIMFIIIAIIGPSPR